MAPMRMKTKRNTHRTFWVAVLTTVFGVGVFAGAPSLTRAQTKNKKLEPGDAVKKKREAEIKAKKGGSLFVLEDIKIEGKVYKPQAFHVINRKELNLEWDVSDPRFRRSFLTLVVKSVRRRPF
jgi:hypothetical protein